MGLLEVALLLAKYNVTNAVRFAFWTAEEFGLVGSTHYVTSLGDAERKDIALYLNFDMIASPNAGYFILDGDGSAFNNSGPVGSDHIERTFEKFFSEHKLISAPSAFTGRSDYGPFQAPGSSPKGLSEICLFESPKMTNFLSEIAYLTAPRGEIFENPVRKLPI